jgi:hypothetical protein
MIPPVTTIKVTTPIDIGKKTKVCHYYRKPRYVIANCRKKTEKIVKEKEKKKEMWIILFLYIFICKFFFTFH